LADDCFTTGAGSLGFTAGVAGLLCGAGAVCAGAVVFGAACTGATATSCAIGRDGTVAGLLAEGVVVDEDGFGAGAVMLLAAGAGAGAGAGTLSMPGRFVAGPLPSFGFG
jgi:hypothetical protein